MRNKGFTLLELLAVLMIIGLSLVVVLGAYTSWATIHALDGAVRTVEGGVLQARALAKANHSYVLFTYSTTDPATNVLRQISTYDIRLCRPDTNGVANPLAVDYQFDSMSLALVTSQRINRHVSLRGGSVFSAMEDYGSLVFTPDGGLAVDEGDPLGPSPHYIVISTRKRFADSRSNFSAESLYRIIRVDYATGLPTALRPDQLNLAGGSP
ncbi:MAG: type II secretion system GspH family protein [Kiritimatiellaeota bacterium]|nr:type II secretion system GspH family protein [Kiritimatiellota bacterium]